MLRLRYWDVSSGGIFDAPGMCSAPETSIPIEEKLGADHYVADWEIRFWKLSTGKKRAETTNASE